MRKAILTLVVFVGFAAHGVANDRSTVLAPLPVRGEFLLSSGYLSLSPSSPHVLGNSQWAVDLRAGSSNTFAVSETISAALLTRNEPAPWRVDHLRSYSGNVFVVDGEIHRATVSIRRGLDSAEVFTSIPVLSTRTAWADKIIETFHADFHLGTDGRSAILRDRQFIYLRSGDREFVRNGAGAVGVGDITIGAKFPLPSMRKTDVAAEILFELPTGNEKILFGSGAFDSAVNLLAARRGERSSIFAATGLTRLGTNTVLGVPEQTIVTTSLGYSRVIGPATAAVVQLTTADSPFKGLNWSELGERFFQFAVGLQYQLDIGHVVNFAVIENAVNYENSADLGVHVGLSMVRR